jgi:hypothetical protein
MLKLTGASTGTYTEPRYYLDGAEAWARKYDPPVDLCRIKIMDDELEVTYSGDAETGKYEKSMYGTGISRWTLRLSFRCRN